jgi:hypothetical protein
MRKLAICLTALTLVGGAVAFATIPDSAGNINACYTPGGALRVVDGSCRPGEISLSWSATARPGVVGPHELVEVFPNMDSQDTKHVEKSCPTGEIALSGGFNIVGENDPFGDVEIPVAVRLFAPQVNAEGRPVGWRLRVMEVIPYAGNWRPVVFVVCAPAA